MECQGHMDYHINKAFVRALSFIFGETVTDRDYCERYCIGPHRYEVDKIL